MARRGARDKKRAEVMHALYRSGLTLRQIGDEFQITRERVRQILSRDYGIAAKDGGQHKRAAQSRAERNLKRDARYFRNYGCSFAQFAEIRALGQQMMASGISRERTPLGAFSRQKKNARHRGIAWELRLWDWWQVWQASGKWDERGRGNGYVMARYGDQGAYTLGNVKIITGSENASEANNKSGLPMGVSIRRGRRYKTVAYMAARMIKGKMLHIGTFRSPELAHAAYLMAEQYKVAA